MKEDFSELIEYLNKKFTNIDEKFDNIDEKFDNVDEKFVNIERELNSLQESKADKSDINNLMNALDAYAKKADTYFQEMVMLAHKVDKLEKWIHQIAGKVGINLEE